MAEDAAELQDQNTFLVQHETEGKNMPTICSNSSDFDIRYQQLVELLPRRFELYVSRGCVQTASPGAKRILKGMGIDDPIGLEMTEIAESVAVRLYKPDIGKITRFYQREKTAAALMGARMAGNGRQYLYASYEIPHLYVWNEQPRRITVKYLNHRLDEDEMLRYSVSITRVEFLTEETYAQAEKQDELEDQTFAATITTAEMQGPRAFMPPFPQTYAKVISLADYLQHSRMGYDAERENQEGHPNAA